MAEKFQTADRFKTNMTLESCAAKCLAADLLQVEDHSSQHTVENLPASLPPRSCRTQKTYSREMMEFRQEDLNGLTRTQKHDQEQNTEKQAALIVNLA